MSECKDCHKSFKNLNLHIVKKHNKFICRDCEKYWPVPLARWHETTKYVKKEFHSLTKYAVCWACYLHAKPPVGMELCCNLECPGPEYYPVEHFVDSGYCPTCEKDRLEWAE